MGRTTDAKNTIFIFKRQFMAIGIAFAIGVLLLFIRLVARNQVSTAIEDPYNRYWLGVVDNGKEYSVLSESLQVVPDDAEEVQAYLNTRPAAHEYYKSGDPRYVRDKKNRYKAEVTINGTPTTVYSQPFINNEAGMQMNLQGRKNVDMYIAPSGEVHLIL